MASVPAVFYPSGDEMKPGDRVKIAAEGFASSRFKVGSQLKGLTGIVLYQVPFLNVGCTYFPKDDETVVGGGTQAMVEPCNLILVERDNGAFSLPAVQKYHELEMLASWMQCSVSSAESVERYEELTEPDCIENLCMDYHLQAQENIQLKAQIQDMAWALRESREALGRQFGTGELISHIDSALKDYELIEKRP
jgi:hypothetical protein